MSIFGSVQLARKKNRCQSDPGPTGNFGTALGIQQAIFTSPSKRHNEIETAPNLLEPDVLEVKALTKNELTCSSRKLPKMARRRRKFNKKLLEVLTSPFGLFLLLLMYMVLGAFMFIYVESNLAESLHMRLEETRMEYAKDLILNESCHEDVECVYMWLRGWEIKLWRFPVGIIDEALDLWSFENAFHLCFSVVTTIGYGNITPVTQLGRILVIFYATFGIPIMLLFVSDMGTVTARWVKRFVLMYRTKQRSKLEARRNLTNTTTSHNAMSTKESTKKNGGNTDEEIGLTLRMKPRLNSKDSLNKDTGFDEHDEGSRDGSDTRGRELPDEMDDGNIHEKNKDIILNVVNAKPKLPGNKQAKHKIPVITVDSDTSCDESDIEEIIGEIIQDDVDLYDTAEIAIHAAWDESESEDDPDVADIRESTRQRRYRDRLSQGEDYSPATTEVIVESKGKSRYRRSLSDPVKETTLGETYSRQRKYLEKAKGTDSNQSFDQSAQNGYAISKDALRASTDTPLEMHNVTKGVNVAESDRFPNRILSAIAEATKKAQENNSQQEHPSHTSTQKIFFNGGVKTSDKPTVSHHKASFQGASPSVGNMDKDVNDLSFPWWMAFFLLFIYLLIGMFMFHHALEWTYLDSFYYSFVSLSTIGFGDLYYQPSEVRGSIFYTFVYCFVGFCYTSMCMSLSSRELLRIARRVAWKIGYYRSRRWKRDFRAFWKARKLKAPRRAGRWTLRRRKPLRVQRIVSETSGVYP